MHTSRAIGVDQTRERESRSGGNILSGWRPGTRPLAVLVFACAALLGAGTTAHAQSAPTVSGVSFSSTPATGQNGTYKLDDEISVQVAFSEAVDVDSTGGTPTVDLTIGSATRQAAYDSGDGHGHPDFSLHGGGG